jgi:hypothetical protein
MDGAIVKVFRLYGTSACHLCELAASMIMPQLVALEDIDLEETDISVSDELFERYGLLIPVLQHPDGRELNWPFTAPQIQAFLSS